MIKKKQNKRYCEVCSQRLYDIGIFCSKECAAKWKSGHCKICSDIIDIGPFVINEFVIHNDDGLCSKKCRMKWQKNHGFYKADKFCIYQSCHSGLFVKSGAQYCSFFCRDEQYKINVKRAEEFNKQVKRIIENVNKQSFNPERFENETTLEWNERVEIMKNAEIASRVNRVHDKIMKLKFISPLYYGPLERAGNLLGGIDSS